MIPNTATNAATRTVPIIPVVASVPTARAARQESILTLAPGPKTPVAATTPATTPATAVVPPARPAPAPAASPAATPTPTSGAGAPPSANAYFEWFQTCRCGHSSAWHGGAFGAAWRSGQQVQGACEASAVEGLAERCACSHFAAQR